MIINDAANPVEINYFRRNLMNIIHGKSDFYGLTPLVFPSLSGKRGEYKGGESIRISQFFYKPLQIHHLLFACLHIPESDYLL